MTANCGNCKYSAPRQIILGTEIFEPAGGMVACRLNPPVPTLTGENVFDKFQLTTSFAFPTVHPTWWCGEHVEVEN